MHSFSKDSDIKRIQCGMEGAIVLDHYYSDQKSKNPTIQNLNEKWVAADLIMFFLCHAMCALARMPKREADTYIREFQKRGLFPYHAPKECTTKTLRLTSRNDWIGKIYDWMTFHSTTRIGYGALRLWNRAQSIRNN